MDSEKESESEQTYQILWGRWLAQRLSELIAVTERLRYQRDASNNELAAAKNFL
jgi:hypothetical protein